MKGYFGRQPNPRNPGKRMQALQLQPSTEAAGPDRDAQPSWTVTGAINCHGHWRQTKQQEVIAADGKYSQTSGVWEIPYVPGLTTLWRVKLVKDSRYYAIVGISNPEEANRELYLFCREDISAKAEGE